MKVFFTSIILSLAAFQILVIAQSVSTTLREMVGEKGYIIETESSN